MEKYCNGQEKPSNPKQKYCLAANIKNEIKERSSAGRWKVNHDQELLPHAQTLHMVKNNSEIIFLYDIPLWSSNSYEKN